jgi:hypothetical protein
MPRPGPDVNAARRAGRGGRQVRGLRAEMAKPENPLPLVGRGAGVGGPAAGVMLRLASVEIPPTPTPPHEGEGQPNARVKDWAVLLYRSAWRLALPRASIGQTDTLGGLQ